MTDIAEATNVKPRIRVPAGRRGLMGNGAAITAKSEDAPLPTGGKAWTNDGFVNYAARLGVGAQNQVSGSRYSFNFITRNRTILEAAYRGSWVVRAAVDIPADDMTRGGVTIKGTSNPKDIEKLTAAQRDLQIWSSMADGERWGRLFGGAIGYIMIDGQNPATPLRLDTISQGQFKGIAIYDRWMVQPSTELVQDLGPDLGKPRFYETFADTPGIPTMKVHYSRVIRFEGAKLPYYQRQYEQGWGESTIEVLWDRLLAYDSVFQGVAQLVYKAHLRVLKMENWRQLQAAGGPMLEAASSQVAMMAYFQNNEGISVIDAKDEMEFSSYTFSGLDNVMIQNGRQLCGALEMPTVRLFGDEEGGLNNNGQGALTNYYDKVHKDQERNMRNQVTRILDIIHRSALGREPPEGFTFTFNKLWEMSPKEKIEAAKALTETVVGAFNAGVISLEVALKELRQAAEITGIWSNITDADIADALQVLPPGESLNVEAERAEDLHTQALEAPKAKPTTDAPLVLVRN